MRKIFILTLGLVLAVGCTTAFAGGRYDHGWSDHRYDHRYDRRDRTHRDAYLVGGLLLGLAAGAALADDGDGWRRTGHYYDSRYDWRHGGVYYGSGYYGGAYYGRGYAGGGHYGGGYYRGDYYDGGYYGGGYYGGFGHGPRPYYSREVIVYRDAPRWDNRRRHAPPRRVVHYRHDDRGHRW